MAVVVPVLRAWLLLLNLYGTFKAIKPPPVSLRNTRNGQGPSGRAMQLRKREMKSSLAVWVVWAIFSTFERPLDRSMGLLTPFYSEIKCTVLLFLIVSRSHGAEAVFLHLIHPLVRPYVPQVDSTLATLQSVLDLVILIVCLPWEYVVHWWRQCSWGQIWSSNKPSPNSGESSPEDSDPEDKELDRRQLRPRNELRQVRLREADRQAQVIFRDIDDARDRVRAQATNHFATRNNARTQPVRETRNTDTNPVGLRTRKRVLDHANALPGEVTPIPGSRSTGLHYLDSTSISQLAQRQQSPVFRNGPASQPVAPSSPPMHIPTPSSSSQSSHEIWYPPQSAIEARKAKSPSPDTFHRTPSPIYPPLPSAYRFTPRRSDPLPPSPRVLTPPDLVTPTPRRVSTGAMSRGAVDAYDGIDQFPGRASQAGPSGSAPLEATVPHARKFHEHSPIEPEDFFRQALESSIQARDVDMQTLPTRDGSSAREASTEEGGIRPELCDMAEPLAGDTKETHGSIYESSAGFTGRTRKIVRPTGTVRRSARTRGERSPSVETDEFGFTIRTNSTALKRLPIASSSGPSQGLGAGPSRKKPLARTKPVLKTTEEDGAQPESSDEESVKKRRKVKPGEGQPRVSADNMHHQEVTSLVGHTTATSSQARRKVAVYETPHWTDSVEDDPKNRQVKTRATRAATRQPLSGQGRTNVIKRERGK